MEHSIKKLSKKEMGQLLNPNGYEWKIKSINNGSNIYHFERFHYFAAEHICNMWDTCDYLVLFNNLNEIIGVIKYGKYETGNPGEMTGINYIDIREDWKNQGCAKLLIKELNNYLDKRFPLYIGSLSPEGKKCKVDRLFKDLITDCEFAPDSKY